jgi:tetratricopeptide (TPR) repeat protein
MNDSPDSASNEKKPPRIWSVRFRLIREASISILILVSVAFFALGVYRSAATQGVDFEPIQIPAPFREKGYTPEISTVRLVDEIKKINTVANTTKKRDSVSSKQPGEELAKISASVPSGIDIHAIQIAIRELLGVHRATISGDITFAGESADKNSYLVRLRQNPGEALLVDEIVTGAPEDVLAKIALSLVERLDPVVAASYYRNSKLYLDSLRMVDVAMTSKSVEVKSHGLDQRIYIYIDQKKFDLAKRDLDTVFAIDKNSANGFGLLALWYNRQGMHKDGLAAAEKQIALRPDLPHGYLNKAVALKGLDQDGDDLYLTALAKKELRSGHYVLIGSYFEAKGKMDLARTAFLNGAVTFPDSASTSLAHGRRLMLDGHEELGLFYLKKAYRLDSENTKIKELLLQYLPKGEEDGLRSELISRVSAK